MRINFKNLQRLLDINENKQVNMSSWAKIEECGTVGCLLGNYFLDQDCNMSIEETSELCSMRISRSYDDNYFSEFNITNNEAEWLFLSSIAYFDKNNNIIHRFHRNLRKTTKEQALNRLRKFIYYKRRKEEFVVQEGPRAGAPTEEARSVSGNKASIKAMESVLV